MSEYLPEEEHAEFRDWCSTCVNEGDSECQWCRDDTPDGVPSCYCSMDYFLFCCDFDQD